MAQNVDPQRVIQKLALTLANSLVQNAMTEVALDDAQKVIDKHGMTPPDNGSD